MINRRFGLWERVSSVRRILGDSISYPRRRAPEIPKMPYDPEEPPAPDWEPSFKPRPQEIIEPHPSITVLHRQYLYHLMMGLSIKKIAKLYGKNPDTITQTFELIVKNMGANSNTHAVAKMIWWTRGS